MTQEQIYGTMGEQRWADDSFMQIRLDTEKILRRIEYFLSSKRAVLKKDGDEWYEEIVRSGQPLANDEGVNGILQLVETVVNPQAVQGNFDFEQYEDFIYYTRIEITKAIINNCYEWGIDDSKIEMIIDNIMRFIEPFMSRVIDNKERDSYARGFQSKEVVVHDSSKTGGLSKFSGGIGK